MLHPIVSLYLRYVVRCATFIDDERLLSLNRFRLLQESSAQSIVCCIQY